jgi:hypothetical protein
MFEKMMGDNLINAFKPQIEKAIEPMFLEMRAALRTRLVGPPPPLFIARAMELFTFSEYEIKVLWEAACESVL